MHLFKNYAITYSDQQIIADQGNHTEITSRSPDQEIIRKSSRSGSDDLGICERIWDVIGMHLMNRVCANRTATKSMCFI